MTTPTSTSTLTDRALAATAGRAVSTARSTGRPYRDEPGLAVAWQGDRGLFTNVACVREQPQDWEDVLARVASTVPPGLPVILVAAGAVPDLSSAGWHLVGHPPLMVRAPGGTGPRIPAELTLTQVSDERGLETFERTLFEEYPDPGLLPYRWGSVYDGRVLGGATRFFLGRVAGRPLVTSAAHVAAGVNLVEMVATAAAARGRGYGAAASWVAATADPSLPAVLIASDSGRPVYERLGFTAVTRWTLWHRPAHP